MSNRLRPKHIAVLDPLRGLAALAVCIYHFTNGNSDFLVSGDPVKSLGSVGWLGVEAFFVISGFVVPYSMHCRGYRVSECLDFFFRRLKRLEPPYVIAILLVIALNWVSSLAPGFRGSPVEVTWPRLLAHFGYLNAFWGLGWLNPVFWTLAIEFQFYIFMAIAYPLLLHCRGWVRVLSVVVLVMVGFGGFSPATLLHWLPLFLIGIVTCQWYVGGLSVFRYACLLGMIAAISWKTVGGPEALIGVFTALAICAGAARSVPRLAAPIAFLGPISYSLYLVHAPVGGRVINLATRLPESPGIRYVALLVAMLVSVAFAAVFWWLVERPSHRWARSVAQPGQQRPSLAATPES
ncbi:MAG: acyltransferase family protein [Aureliella sp.]